MHYAIGDLLKGEDAEKAKREARIGVLLVYSRIVLRLNRTEPMHNELRDKLDALMRVETVVPDRAKVEAAVDLARQILKQEWDVAKYGCFVPPLRWIKSHICPHQGNYSRVED